MRLQSPEKFDAFEVSVESNRQLDVLAMHESDYYEKSSKGTATFLSGFFFSIGAMIGAMMTMHATIAQRRGRSSRSGSSRRRRSSSRRSSSRS